MMVKIQPMRRIEKENQRAVPDMLSSMMTMMLSAIRTRSQMSNFLPAGVSDLKMMV